jgi:hypothetical protein
MMFCLILDFVTAHTADGGGETVSPIDFSNDENTCAIQPLIDALFANVLYDEEPLFISDEATTFDVSVATAEELIQRCSDYY